MCYVQQHDNINCRLEIQGETVAAHDDNIKCAVCNYTSHKEKSSAAFVITDDNGLFAIIDQFAREIYIRPRGMHKSDTEKCRLMPRKKFHGNNKSRKRLFCVLI